MGKEELGDILTAILMMFVVSSLTYIFVGEMGLVFEVFIYSFIIIILPVVARKAMAHSLDAGVEHQTWGVHRFGLRPGAHFKREVPMGLLVPLFFTLISLGLFKVMTFLTYEPRALKHRAAKRFGHYSFTEMTDWHGGLIGVAGIVTVLVISFVGYFAGFELLSKLAAYYAFWNMIPIFKLDGTQIFFGNKIVYSVLGIITLIFVLFAMSI
jgi:Zn-dependent protease